MGVRTIIIAAVIFLLFLFMVTPAGAVYLVGDHVNDFTLPDAYGNQVSLYDYQDRVVALVFWFSG
ncbi:hypothetical protein AMJ86_06480 [bacterium SM23_57]|nr:MAG: hypothetical protein AMJ86_06480 [bacterium SM23_57]